MVKFKQNFIRLFLSIVLMLNVSALHALSYDDDILNIYSKILPRFIIMSSIKEKIKDNVEICILYDDIDALVALSLVDKVKSNYPKGIKKHKINLLTTTYSNITKCENAQLVFMFNSNEKNINNAVVFSNKQSTLTMSYDAALLENGVEISLFIGRKVLPYINMGAIINNKIELDNLLLRISKIYTGKDN